MKPSLEVFDYLEIKKPGSATPCLGLSNYSLASALFKGI
jgi:hypothetical protein